MKYDFAGYATKHNIKCSDGRTILKDAFAHNDQATVPLVWHHMHNDPSNILGHAKLEARDDGMYCYCTFNTSQKGQEAKELVKHGDINSLSIFANDLVQKGSDVAHGEIREVSLVLTGANSGAKIDNIQIAHADGSLTDSSEDAIIYSGELLHSADNGLGKQMHTKTIEHEDKTLQDIMDTLNEEQMEAVYAVIGMAVEGIEHGGYGDMKRNIFDNSSQNQGPTLSHAEKSEIFMAAVEDSKKTGSLKESLLAHAATYGIEDIGILFPDATEMHTPPEFIKRDTEWVAGVISGTKHTPFSRIKTTFADITADEARAKGYDTKGTLKKEEIIKLLKRVTTPTTIYKKQKLDRDDIIDITSYDVVPWLKAEMRMMLDEELARAVLIGDGRDISAEDKINEDHIRPIHKDEDLYSHKVSLPSTATSTDVIEAVIRSRKHYKGSGSPVAFMQPDVLTDMLLIKDSTGRKIYESETSLASALRVSKIVEVPIFEGAKRVVGSKTYDLLMEIVNLKDYAIGADKGGQLAMFDDFDIDYNQYKYLMETRVSGALIRPKSAIIIEKEHVAG